MSKRSKVVLIILIVFVVLVFLSMFNEEASTDEKLAEWEEEIKDPNNQLDPLNEKVGKNVFIIDIGQKIENIIEKIFSFVVGFFEGIVESIFVFINEPLMYVL